MRLTSEHVDGVPAEVGLDKEFVVGSTYQKLYINVEKRTDDFSPGKISGVPRRSCCGKNLCVLELVVSRMCCLMAWFRGRSWPVERAVLGLLA